MQHVFADGVAPVLARVFRPYSHLGRVRGGLLVVVYFAYAVGVYLYVS